MPEGVDEDKITGVLVDVDVGKGTMTIEAEGDFYVCLWTSDFEAEIGDTVTINVEDVLN